jgi:hypothetical protein
MRAIPYDVRSALSFALLAVVFLIAAVYFLTTPASVANVPVSAAATPKSAATVAADTVAASKNAAAAPVGAAAASKAAATAPVSAAAAPKSVVVAQNLCVHGADGAIVCGPVAKRGNDPSPFDRPGVAQPVPLAPMIAEPPPAPRRAARRVERHVGPAKHVYRPLHSRELEGHPPRRIAREHTRHLPTVRDPRSPLRLEREPPVPHRMADWRRRESERALRHAEREHAVRRYADRGPPPAPRLDREQAVQFADLERRTRALEQEIRVLRAERDSALRHVERRDTVRRIYHEPRSRYRQAQPRYEPEPSSVAQRTGHRPVDRYRRSLDD